MSQTITVTPKTIEAIVEQLTNLTKEVKAIKAKLFEEEPLYGSDEWWEWSDKKAIEEIGAGKGIKISNKKELSEFFRNL